MIEQKLKTIKEKIENVKVNDSLDFCFVCSKCKKSITEKSDFYFTKSGKILCGKCVLKGRKK